jgi:hypothetical protein
MFELGYIAACAQIGSATSNVWPTWRPVKPRGATPITSTVREFSASGAPIARGSPPSSRCQKS